MPERVAVSLSAWRLPLEQALDRAHDLGARAVDIIAIPGWGQLDPAAVARDPPAWIHRVGTALRRRGLRCSAINAALPEPHRTAPPALRRHALLQADALAQLCAGLGARVVSLYPGYVHPGDAIPGGLAATCRNWVAIGRRHGVHLAPEVHWRSALPTPEAALQLARQAPGLRFTLDPSHQLAAGLPLTDWRPLLDRVVHVHWRNAANGRLQAPWDGGLQVQDLRTWLASAGYAGWHAAETLPEDKTWPSEIPAILAWLDRID